MPRHLLPALLLLSACGGGSLYSTINTQPSAAPGTVFDCVRAKFKELGYEQTSYDVNSHRLTARHIDETVHRVDVQFRRQVDRMIVEITPGSDGRSVMMIESHTFAELETVRGPTDEEKSASPGARAAAAAMIEACGK